MNAPLSSEQLTIWKRHRSKRRSDELNIPVTARLFGEVDKDALSSAVRGVIDRHVILRTVFPESEGIPRHEVLDVAAAPVLSKQQVDTFSITQAINAAVDYNFDLARETPVRAHLFSSGQSEHTLLFVIHRIAFDSHSVDPLIRDFFAFYSACIENREPLLPPISDSIMNCELRTSGAQYTDNARIKDIEAIEENITNGDAEDFRSEGIIPVRINPGVHGRLVDFAKEAGVSLDSVLHAGLSLLFSRFDFGDRTEISTIRRADFLSANADTQRTVSECCTEYRIHMMVGNFETVLPFKVSTQGNPTFREVVNRAANEVTTCTVNQPGCFRVLFRLKPVGVETFEFPGLKVFVKPVTVTERGYELIFDLSERLSAAGKPQGIEGSVIFNSKLLASQYMPAHLAWLMALLKHGVQNPDAMIDELSVEEKPPAWECTALTTECLATAPEYATIKRIASVHDNGRQVKVTLDDTPVSSTINAVTGWQQSYVAFQDALQCRLVGIWEETLGISRIGVRDRFADLGGDTDDARRVVTAINTVFRKNLPVSLMCGGVTVESLANAIFLELPFEPVSVIQPVLPDSKPPLFFMHGVVFGGGLYMIELSQYLGSDRPVFSFNPHGMNGLDIPETIEKMAEENLKILRQVYPEGPFRLGGFCNGALVAYEMARMMEREGQDLKSPLLLVEAPQGDISGELSQSAAKQKTRSAKSSTAPQGLQMRKTWALNELFRLSGSYRPGKYAGSVIVVQPKKSLLNETIVKAVWKKAVDDIRFLNTPGDHITCIGRHAPELAGILREVMDV